MDTCTLNRSSVCVGSFLEKLYNACVGGNIFGLPQRMIPGTMEAFANIAMALYHMAL